MTSFQRNKHLDDGFCHINKRFRVLPFPLNLVVSFNVFSVLMLSITLKSANVYPLDYLIHQKEPSSKLKKKKKSKKEEI